MKMKTDERQHSAEPHAGAKASRPCTRKKTQGEEYEEF